MILKASQRSGAKQLGLHLMKTEENEHVEVHEISGFVSDDLMGAMKEAYALSMGTKCKQHLFSVSLNPPQNESVRVEVFEQACKMIEERMGLTGHAAYAMGAGETVLRARSLRLPVSSAAQSMVEIIRFGAAICRGLLAML